MKGGSPKSLSSVLMFRSLAVGVLLCCAIPTGIYAQEVVSDLVTPSGATYKAARVQSVDGDGVTYFHAGGVVKIAFAELPASVQKKYGYDALMQPPTPVAPRPAPTPSNVIYQPVDPLAGASIVGYSREAVLLKLVSGITIGRRLEDLDPATREMITKLLDAEEEAKKKLEAEALANNTAPAASTKPNALYDDPNKKSSRRGGGFNNSSRGGNNGGGNSSRRRR